MLIPKRTSGSSSGASALNQLTDVAITAPSAGQVIAYDATQSKWVNIGLLFSRVGTITLVNTSNDTVSVSFPTGGYVPSASVAMTALPLVGANVVVEFMADGRAVVTGAIIQPFAPTSISGLDYWFDAADLGTIVTTAGTVTQWNDKSGSGLYVTPVSTSPFLTTAPNGRPALGFQQSPMNSSGNYAEPSVVTHFAVIKLNNSTNGGAAGGQPIVSQNQSNFIGTTNQYLSRGWDVSRPGEKVAYAANAASTDLTLLQADSTGNLLVNGVTVPMGVSYDWIGTDASYTTPQPIAVGGLFGVAGETFQGLICEIVRYDRALTSTEITSVQQYLKTKWSLSF